MVAPVALVVGAASTLGKGVVRRLAFAGYNVAAADQCANAVGKVAEDNKKVGAKVTAFAFDSSKDDHRTELLERVQSELGGLNSLVIVPPKNENQEDILDTSSMKFDSMFNSYVSVPFFLAKAAVPILKNNSNGSIVFLASAAGYSPQLSGGLYSLCSTAVFSLSKTMAQAAGKHGVRVNTVVTGMVEGDGSGYLWDELSGSKGEDLRQGLESMIPLGRLGRPSDVASFVEFLISDRAKYVSGETVTVNGGVSFRL